MTGLARAVMSHGAALRARIARGWQGHAGEALRGTVLGFALRVCGLGLGVVFNVALARALGVEGAGVYFLAFTFQTLASGLGRIGLDQTLLRFAAARHHGGRAEELRGLYRRGIALGTIGSAATAALLFLAAPWLAAALFGNPALVTPLRWMALAVVPFSLLNLHAELLKAVDRLVAATLVQAVGVPLLSLVLLGLAMTLEPGPAGAALIYAVACASVALWAFGLWWRVAPDGGHDRPGVAIGELLVASLPLFWVTAMQLVLGWADNLLLGVWTDSATVGAYHVAKRTALLTAFIIVAVNSAVGPKFAALHAAGRDVELAGLARRTAQMMLLYATPLCALFLLWPDAVLHLFGSGFAAAAWPLRILAIAQFLVMVSGPAMLLLIMSGTGTAVRNAMILAAALNVSLNVILIPLLGAVGAALAHAGSALLLTALLVTAARRRLGISTLPLSLRRRGGAGPG